MKNQKEKKFKVGKKNVTLRYFLWTIFGIIMLSGLGFAGTIISDQGIIADSGLYDTFNVTNLTVDKINEVLYVEAGNFSDIQAKIDMCGSEGCKVVIPKGIYDATTGINVTAIPSLVIEGNGKGTVLNITANLGASTALFYGTDVQGFELRDLKIQGNNISDSGVRITGTSENVKIINVESSHHRAYGISIAGVNNLLISGTKTNNNTDRSDGEGRGIYITANTNVIVENCEASYNKRYGIMAHSNIGLKISNCVVNYNLGDRGIFVFRGREIIISDNIALYNNFAAITVESADAIIYSNIGAYSLLDGFLARNENVSIFTGNLVLSNNQFYSNARYGIHIDQRINNTLIANNFIVNNSNSGIRLSNNIQDGFITGNYIVNNNGSGIHASTNVDNFVISGNYLKGTALSGVQAIRIGTSDVDNMAIRDNYYTNWLSDIFDGGTGTTFGLTADTISEQTGASGVTIDGVLLKDGQILWSALTGFPVACPAGTSITEIGTSTICSTVSAISSTSSYGLVAYYPLDNSTTDYSGSGNHGEIQGAGVTLNDTGRIGSAYNFAGGGDDFINLSIIEAINLTGTFTISGWFYKTTSANTHVFAQTRNTNDRFDITVSSSGMKIGYYDGSSYSGVVSGDVSQNVWYHFAYSYNNGTGNLTLNGAEQSGGAEPSAKLGTNVINIGASGGNSEEWVGLIDDIRVYDRDISFNEKLQIYNSQSELFAKDGYHVKGKDINPILDAVYNLGSSILRWAKGWFVDLDVSGDLFVGGENVTDQVYTPEYIFAHTNATQPLTQNVWLNITFAQEAATIKRGIIHTFSDATNTTFTILSTGVYLLDYNYDMVDSAASPSADVAGRALRNDVEIIGSVFETDTTKQNAENELSHEFMANLVAGDEIKFQMVTDVTTLSIQTHSAFGDHPSSASIVIQKISN